MSKERKILELTRLQGELLREHKTGHLDWYAEMLVCAALNGELAKTNNPDFDVRCESLGTIQVKCRIEGTDTTQNRTNFGKYKSNAFDFAAIVIFESDYYIKGAAILSLPDAHSIMRKSGHVKWADISNHANSISITNKLKAISGE